MRLAGRITDWNDDKGFGFVMPNGGGDRAFVHVNEFQRGSRRPVSGDLISYLPGKDAKGRLQARQIRHAGQKIETPRQPSRVPRAALGVGALAAIAAAAALGAIPVLMAVAWFAASGLAWLMYSFDKAAARRDAQRTPENSLHLVSLCGGWPGALIAQQQFRHKTVKQPFQSVFWITVVLNLAAAWWLVSTGMADELARTLGG
ncbi:DUF1294 domain-containing protein [Luteimonas sp. A611]